MENSNKITVWLSTDGKLSISFNAQDTKEANTLYTEVEGIFRKLVTLKNELGLVIKAGGYPSKKPVEKDWTGNKCPKDQGRLYQATTKNGKKMIKCENSRWNPVSKQSSGCDYIEWLNDSKDSQKQFENEVKEAAAETSGVKMATQSQINLIQKLQGEGRISELVVAKDLTLDQAKELISSSINK